MNDQAAIADSLEDFLDSDERGFTLVELLVVSVLLAIMSAILYGTITGIMRGRALIEHEREISRSAQYVLERVCRELRGRVLTSLSPPDTGEEDSPSRQQFGRSYFEGINSKKGLADADRVRFVSMNAGQAFIGMQSNYGLVQVEYYLDEPKQRMFGERPKDGLENLLLVRQEHPADVREKKVIKSRRTAIPLAENVVSLNFRYLKEGKWQDEWKTERSPLPEAIEITLRLRGAEEQIETFRTAVAISRPQRRVSRR